MIYIKMCKNCGTEIESINGAPWRHAGTKSFACPQPPSPGMAEPC